MLHRKSHIKTSTEKTLKTETSGKFLELCSPPKLLKSMEYNCETCIKSFFFVASKGVTFLKENLAMS